MAVIWKFPRVSTAACWLVLGAAALVPSLAAAQAYPSKPIHFIVTYVAGSGTDTVGRVFADKLTRLLGQPVIVENKPGANGTIGSNFVAKSAPDGYTLMIGATTNAVVQTLMKSVPYDTERDFTPISFLGSLPQVVTVTNSLPVKNLAELIAYARANPGKVTYAWPHLVARIATETLASMAGVKFFDVPYKSSPQAMADVISGEVQLYIADLIVAMPQVRAGKIRALGVTSLTRASTAPDVPTIAEAGWLPNYQALGLFGLFGPAGLPADVVAKLNAAAQKACEDPELRSRLAGMGLEVQSSTPAELVARMRAEKQHWFKVTKEAGIEPQ